ncbi:MAG: TonB-dependent receptor [Alphaproteobacteria bacterium]|nr:TonB-dependent receptor [Alphaproteobacteria bacterium]
MKAAAAALLLATASGAYAQTTDKDSVLAYPASFFADMRPNTAMDMIGRLPGFSFTNTGSARGFAGNAGNVLIDGQRPTSKSDDLQSILGRIPAADVERIDVIRGGAPGIDMQGLTVVANVIRKKESSTQWVLEASENVFQDGHTIPGLNLNYTRHDGPKTFEFSATRYNSFDDSVGNGFHSLTFLNPDGTVDESFTQRAHTSGHGSGGAFTGAATLPMWGGTFKANIALQDSPFMSSAEYFGAPGHRYISDVNVSRNLEVGLHWNGNFGKLEDETLFLQRIGFSKDVNASFETGDDEVFRSSSSTDETILRETLRWPLSQALTLEAGGEGAYNSLDGDTAFAINGLDFPLPDAHAHVDEKRGEVFGQGTWKISPEWLLEAGARFEYSRIAERSDTTKQQRAFSYPKPRAVLTWSPTKDDQVRLRYEKVVGQLDFGNFIAAGNLGGNGVTGGNSNIRPDQRTQYEASYEHHFWDKGDVTLQLIHEDITDVVDLVEVFGPDGTPFDAPGNIGNGVNNQINLTVTVPFDKLWIPNGLLKIGSNLQYSSVRDPVTGEHRVITAERPQDITLKFTQDIESLKSTWYVFYYNCWDEKYFRVFQTQHRRTIAPYLEAGWTYKPTPDWSFEFDVINFGRFTYDNQYFDFDGPRDTGRLALIEERTMKSQPRIFIDIRKTF